MRKRKVLFLCTQNSARSQMAEGFLRDLAGDRFEAYSAGIDPTDEIHPCAVEAMSEVGIDISEQYPKGLRTYLGKMGFNYLIIVCARAEERCPKTFPGVGARFSWVFEDPRRDEEIPYDSMLERFRTVRDEIELKIRDWLEHPEQELKKLKEERERQRRERLAAARWEADEHAQGLASLPQDIQERRHHLPASGLALARS
jgi:arsenate reductase (thioredoxin)